MEWISVKDKLPEDINTIDEDNKIYAVIWYMPLKLVDNVFLIDDYCRRMLLVERIKGMSKYHWVDSERDGIYDEQVIAWLPIPKYEEGGSDVSRNDQ